MEQPMTPTREAVRSTLLGYARDFTRFDVDRIVKHYHDPCTLVSSQGVTALAGPDAIRAAFASLVGSLKARGVAKAEFTELHIWPLGDTLALAGAVAKRSAPDGHELERTGATYLLRKEGDHWRIAVLATHDVGRVIRLRQDGAVGDT